MNQEQLKKKIDKVLDLIIAVYKEHLNKVFVSKRDGCIVPRVIFKNKPEQSFCIGFITKDTWTDIKRKMSKLIESDGICVVCFEKETYNNVRCDDKKCDCKYKEIPEIDSLSCLECCEMYCFECFDRMKGVKCPVCRASYNDKLKYYLPIAYKL